MKCWVKHNMPYIITNGNQDTVIIVHSIEPYTPHKPHKRTRSE